MIKLVVPRKPFKESFNRYLTNAFEPLKESEIKDEILAARRGLKVAQNANYYLDSVKVGDSLDETDVHLKKAEDLAEKSL